MRRERPTAAYRLYFFDPENHIENVEILECACDQEALATAARLMNGRDLELWDRDRFISRLPKT